MDVALKYWFQEPNAGDLFSKYLAERHLGPVTANGDAAPFGSLNVMLLGSLMHWCDRNTIVCGAGMISPRHKPPQLPRRIFAVRGPRTRAQLLRLGADVPAVYGDPGVLAAEFASSKVAGTHEYGLVLHDADRPWERKFGRRSFRSRSDTLYIDVRQDPVTVINQINRCETIFSSSLHGIVFAHAVNKKALWVRCSDKLIGGTFKFYDYFDSLGIDEDSVDFEQIETSPHLPSLARRARTVDVSPLVRSVHKGLAETRAYLESCQQAA